MRRQNFMLTHAITADPVYEFATEVHAGLTKPGQKELPSKYLYDDVGSALFEVISVLPEYGLTRADERLLGRYASEIVERLPLPLMVAELGSGCRKISAIGTRDFESRRLSAARNRSGKAHSTINPSLQRPTRGHGRVQCKPAGQDQS